MLEDPTNLISKLYDNLEIDKNEYYISESFNYLDEKNK